MSRTLTRPQKAFFLAVVITVVLAFLPARWLGPTSDLAAVVNVPLMPFRHIGKQLQGWLRPPVDAIGRAGDENLEQQLWEERAEFERLYHESQLRITELQDIIQQLQQVPLEELNSGVKPLAASVTGSNPRSRSGIADLNRGQRHGVIPGTIAVYAGVHLIGQVSEVNELSCKLLPITSAAIQPMRARVLPQDQPERPITDAPLVLLESLGDGRFEAEIEHIHPVNAGDVVRLDDDSWPRTAQAMILGLVERVEPKDENRLLNRLIIRPRYQLSQLSHVALKIELTHDQPSEGGAP